jgi:hypothetical protein
MCMVDDHNILEHVTWVLKGSFITKTKYVLIIHLSKNILLEIISISIKRKQPFKTMKMSMCWMNFWVMNVNWK